MSTKYTCCGSIWDGWRSYRCGKNAKFDRDGSHYCGMHDPVTIAEKNAVKRAAWEAECEAKDAATKARIDKQAEIERRADCYTELLEALQWYVENDDVILEMPGNEFYAEGYHKAKAAIAKALGERA